MTSGSKRHRGWIALLLAVLWVLPFPLPAQAKGKGSAAQKPSKKPAAIQRPAGKAAKPSTRRLSAKERRRRARARRLAKLRLEPQRVEEIQRGLIQAGYLKQEPTGKWDDPTREAMRRYQTDNGFPSTGLPEAKSLMKLGLGPHPLPEDVDPRAPAQASVDTSAKPDSPGADPPADASAPPASPPQNR